LKAIAEEVGQLLAATATLQAPRDAVVGVPIRAVLVVSATKNPEILAEEARLRSAGDTVTTSATKIGVENDVIFTASCGDGCVRNMSPKIQAYTGQDLVWEWSVTPPDARDLELTASLWVNVQDPAHPGDVSARTGAKTLEATIHVHVTPSARVTGFIQTNWQWLLTAVPPSAIWAWHRNNKKKKPRSRRR